MNKKLTIMQVLPSLNQGGVERGTIDLSKFLAKHNCNSIVISNGGVWLHELDNTGVKHIQMQVGSKNPIKMWLNSRKLKQLIKDYDVDIIHARSRAPAWASYWASKGTNAKFLTTFHGAGNLPKNSILRFFKKYYNSIMCTSIPTITPSKYTKNFIAENYGVKPCNLKVIYRWVDLEKYDSKNLDKKKLEEYRQYFKIPKDAKVIVNPSRFSRVKGSHTIIKAMAKLKGNYYCIINVGKLKNQEYYDEVKKLVKDLKLEDKVFFNSQMSSQPEYLFPFAYVSINAATTEETFGRTIVESFATGVPCICTNIGGPREIIQENKSGWLIKPDDTESLAKALDYVLNLPAKEYEKLQKNCKERAKYFSMDEKCQETLDLYNELLTKGWDKKC